MYGYETRSSIYEPNFGLDAIENYGRSTRSLLNYSGLSNDVILGSAMIAVAFLMTLLFSGITGVCVGLSDAVSQLTLTDMFWAAIILGIAKAFAAAVAISCQQDKFPFHPAVAVVGEFVILLIVCGLAGLLSIWWPVAAVCCLSISCVAALAGIPIAMIHAPFDIPCNGILILVYNIFSGVALYQFAQFIG